jgi:hypothetical protein
LSSQKPSATSKLIWTRFAAFAGEGSTMPHADLQWAWDLGTKLWGEDHAQIGLGGALRWRISVRPETWLMYVDRTGEIDPVSQKEITISSYWIDDNYTHPKHPDVRKRPKLDISKLKSAWGHV